MAVDVNITDEQFEIGQTQKLFSKTMNFSGAVSTLRYAVANDGQRFLMNIPLDQNSDDHIILVQNWLSELGH